MITQSMQRLIFDIHFTKEKLVDGILDLRSIRSEDQIADEITKRPLNLDV